MLTRLWTSGHAMQERFGGQALVRYPLQGTVCSCYHYAFNTPQSCYCKVNTFHFYFSFFLSFRMLSFEFLLCPLYSSSVQTSRCKEKLQTNSNKTSHQHIELLDIRLYTVYADYRVEVSHSTFRIQCINLTKRHVLGYFFPHTIAPTYTSICLDTVKVLYLLSQ